jgi:hypothetical protein
MSTAQADRGCSAFSESFKLEIWPEIHQAELSGFSCLIIVCL